MDPGPELHGLVRAVVGTAGGLAIGLEREWSRRSRGAGAAFGVRTCALFGLAASSASWLWTQGLPIPSVVLLGTVAAILVGYSFAGRTGRRAGATSQAAAAAVLCAGVLAGAGYLVFAGAVVALTCLLLVERSPLHAFIAKIEDAELHTAARFAVMAIVIWPILPAGPFGPLGGFRPRDVWGMTLLLSGTSFAAYIARRFVGERHGTIVLGGLAGLVSSTAVTVLGAKSSRDDPDAGTGLAIGACTAGTTRLLRVLVLAAVLSPALALRLALLLAAPFAVGAALVAVMAWRNEPPSRAALTPKNPLQIGVALPLALIFQLALFAVHAVETHWGSLGVAISGAVVGLVDVEAVVFAVTRTGLTEGTHLAARAIAFGIASDALVKIILAVVMGRGTFRWLAPILLSAILIATLVPALLVR